MLSYQHGYHAGNRADIHKHAVLCAALAALRRKAGSKSLVYFETHAGRGRYDLRAPESAKTGEAATGWGVLHKDPAALKTLPPAYLQAVRAQNRGQLWPYYPGSPLFAASVLGPKDSLHLCELHPQEHAALEKLLRKDVRVQIHKRDGYEAALAQAQSGALDFVLVDPSYEVKAEYESVPEFVRTLRGLKPQAGVLVWAPMLPAARHEGMLAALQADNPAARVSQITWAAPGEVRGMYGSALVFCGEAWDNAGLHACEAALASLSRKVPLL